MKKITEESLEKIDNADLLQIMASHGHYPSDHHDPRNYAFCCPFHDEKTPSFLISKGQKSGGRYNTPFWKCFGCGASGFGALQLEAKLSNLDLHSDFIKIVQNISMICNIAIDEVNVKNVNGIVSFVDPQDEFTFEYKDTFSIEDLKALGCDCKKIYTVKNGRRMPKLDKNGNFMYKYSFGKGFDREDKEDEEPNFDPNDITKMFSLYPLKSYTTSAIEKNGRKFSVKVESTDTFPIYAYQYDNKTWGRIYQPCYQKKNNSDKDRRFSFWYKSGIKKDGLDEKVYGDAVVMNALEGIPIPKTIKSLGLDESIAEVNKDGDTIPEKDRRVYDLIICSGGSDAINTYFNSSAHVCWLNSETPGISQHVWNSLNKIAINIYIMFDIDDTGKRMALKAALTYMDLRLIFLPEQLKTCTVWKGGVKKRCKDAKDFFTIYNPREKEEYDGNARKRFKQLMKASLSLKFWNEEPKYDKDGKTLISMRYSINSARTYNFLASQGLFRYVDWDSDDKVGTFVLIKGQIVEYVSKDSVDTVAFKMMKDYIERSSYFCEELFCAIINSPRINNKSIGNNLPVIDLDFHSWGIDFDYLMFENTTVKITKDRIIEVPYSNFPYNVLKQAIKPHTFKLIEKLPFEIYVNPEYQALEDKLTAMKKDPAATKEELKATGDALYSMANMKRYKVNWLKPMNEQPIFVQLLYNMSRVYWRKEIEQGLELTPDEKQEQDMHFVNKFCAFGMALCRYRNSSLPYMELVTEASVRDEGKPTGGTGKSLLISLMDTARDVLTIDGKSYDQKKGALNFQRFLKGKHTIIHMEDMDKKLDIEALFVLISSGMTVRALYQNEVYLPKEEAPILVGTSNYNPDISSDSTQRRLFLLGMSDYYHSENMLEGIKARTPAMEFGDVKNMESDELNAMLNCMAYSIQFFMKVGDRIQPPMRELKNRQLISTTGKKFVEWANEFFSHDYHFNCPLDRDTMFEDYIDYCEVSSFKKDKFAVSTFKDKLEKYCNHCGYIMNPPVVLRTDSDRKRKEMRVKAWVKVTFFRNTEKEVSVRIFKSSNGCLYFCKKGEEPLKYEDVKKAPKIDPEPILDEFDKPIVVDQSQIPSIPPPPNIMQEADSRDLPF